MSVVCLRCGKPRRTETGFCKTCNCFLARGSGTGRTKRPSIFPLGCAIIAYATMGVVPIAEMVGYRPSHVLTRLRRAGIAIRPRGGPRYGPRTRKVAA